MKKLLFKIAVLLVIFFFFYSCLTPSYYKQVYDIKSTQEGYNLGRTYDDGKCTITYDFWAKGGKVEFIFKNNTDNYLYIDLSKCFFVIGDFAYDYFHNRIVETNEGYYIENPIVCVPAKTMKKVSCEYPIYNQIYRDCDLILYPNVKHHWDYRTKQEIYESLPPVSYTLDNSPIVFSNIVTYYEDTPENSVKAVSYFYVSQIANYKDEEVFSSIKSYSFCDVEINEYGNYFTKYSPLRFYNNYTSGQKTINKH